MVKALILDCFGVLYIDPGLGFYEKEVKEFQRLRLDILDIDKQYDYGLIDELQHDQAIADLTGLPYKFVHDNVRGKHTKNDRLIEFSQSLRPQYKIGMLSNIGTNGMWSFFTKEQCDEYFDAYVLSSDIGITKPNREIYVACAERLGVLPEECVMIDDRQDNVDGAYGAGMQGVLYKNTEQCIAEIQALIRESHAGVT